jgi:hypothetical protein
LHDEDLEANGDEEYCHEHRACMEATEEVVLVVDAPAADLIEYLEGGFEEKLDGVLGASGLKFFYHYFYSLGATPVAT